MGRQNSAIWTAILAGTVVPAVVAHGWIAVPAARQLCEENEEYKQDIYIGGGSSTGDKGVPLGGVPDHCGDPFMDRLEVKDGVDGWTNFIGWPCAPQETYEEGGIMETTIACPANHGGWFEMHICDSTEMSDECFNEHHLVTVEHGAHEWYIMEGNRDGEDEYTMQWQLPAGLTCNHCVIRWTWYTAHLCTWPCDREICGWYADGLNYIVRPGDDEPKRQCDNLTPAPGERPQIWRNCADIAILPAGGGPVPNPTPDLDDPEEPFNVPAPAPVDDADPDQYEDPDPEPSDVPAPVPADDTDPDQYEDPDPEPSDVPAPAPADDDDPDSSNPTILSIPNPPTSDAPAPAPVDDDYDLTEEEEERDLGLEEERMFDDEDAQAPGATSTLSSPEDDFVEEEDGEIISGVFIEDLSDGELVELQELILLAGFPDGFDIRVIVFDTDVIDRIEFTTDTGIEKTEYKDAYQMFRGDGWEDPPQGEEVLLTIRAETDDGESEEVQHMISFA